MQPEISVVIPAYNSRKTIKAVLDALAAQSSKNFEVLVVDDGSTDNTAEIVEEPDARFLHQLDVVRLSENHGPAFARNMGADAAVSDILLFIDSDLNLLPNAVEEVVKTMREEDVVVGQYAKEAVEPGFFQEYMALWKWHTRPQTPQYVSFTPGSLFAIKKELFVKAGGFDAHYRKPDVEDYEFGYRVGELAKIKFEPGIQGRHHFQRFWPSLRNYYKRSSMWMGIYRRRRKFDNFHASKDNAINHLLAVGSMLSMGIGYYLLPFSVTGGVMFITASAVMELMFQVGVDDFLTLCGRERGGWFEFKALITLHIISIPIVLGAGVGFLRRL